MKLLERFFYFLQSRKKRLHVRQTKNMGRGVFALRTIRKDEIIEIAPLVIFSSDESRLITKTVLNHYVFQWGKETAVALGIMSLVNSNEQNPNVTYENDRKNKTIIFSANRDISPGEQLFIAYGYDAADEWQKYLDSKKQKDIEVKKSFKEFDKAHPKMK